MAKSRKSKIKPLAWTELGLTKIQGEALEAAGCTTFLATKWVEVEIPAALSSWHRTWEGTIAGAFARGFVTAEQAALLSQGHGPMAMQSLQESKIQAELLITQAESKADLLVREAEARGQVLLEEATAQAQKEHRRSALDLQEEIFGRDGGWAEVLEAEVHRAIRFTLRVQVGPDRCQVFVDWAQDRIEVSRGVKFWVFTATSLEEADEKDASFEGILPAVREALEDFIFEYENVDLSEFADEELGLMLLQHRARAALAQLKNPAGEQGVQLMLEL